MMSVSRAMKSIPDVNLQGRIGKRGPADVVLRTHVEATLKSEHGTAIKVQQGDPPTRVRSSSL
jgi:hypothetical protein